MHASTHADPAGLEIAVIGMAGRFPGAGDLDAFWKLIEQGREGLTRFSDEDLRSAGVDEQRIAGPHLIRALGLLEGVDQFDARFFGFSPGDAELLDPQHRFFLETAWEALETAGYMPEKYSGSIGVFAGCGHSPYAMRVATDPGAERRGASYQKLSANEKDHLTTCAAYRIGLTGPAVTVQTSCSTSLVAVHMACRGLLCGECDIALAGGASVGLGPESVVDYQEGNILSSDGRCRTFDAAASGTVVSNGVGVVVLKRLQDAVGDGDTIRAVILASAINNDGAVKVGYVAPSVTGQAAVVEKALHLSGISADTIQYVEAHGTATQKGDPVEFEALVRAYRSHTPRKQFCAIGSVKANIGHADAAAGVAGFIKAVLSLQHATLPPLVHFAKANAQIDLPNSPFYTSRTAERWEPPNGSARRAAVSSFGVGGTNAHVILEEAPAPVPRSIDSGMELVTLSARTPAALRESVARLRVHLRSHPDLLMRDVAFTLRAGRRDLRERMYCVGERESVLQQLDAWIPPARGKRVRAGARVALALNSATEDLVRLCRACFRANEDFSHVAYEIIPGELLLESGQRALDVLTHDVPVCSERLVRFLLHVVLFRWLGSLRIEPVAIVADSRDEMTSACLAGALTFDAVLEHLTETGGSEAGVGHSEASVAYWSASRRAWIEPGDVPAEGTDLDQRASCVLATGDGALDVFGRPDSGSQLKRLVLLDGAGGECWPQILRAIGELWCLEVPVDTLPLFVGRDCRRVPLPTYPFERERYWIEPRPAAPTPREDAAEISKDRVDDADKWFYSPVLRQLPLLRSSSTPDAETIGCWVVFSGVDDPVAIAFAERERARGATVYLAEELGISRGVGAEEYLRLCRQVPLSTEKGSCFVLFDSYVEAADEGFEEGSPSAWFCVPLFLAQALGEQAMERSVPTSALPRVRIALVSKGMISADGETDSIPRKSMAVALLKVVSQEYAHIATQVIDLPSDAYATYSKGRRLDLLCAELGSAAAGGCVLLRGLRRWTRDFERMPAPTGQSRLRSGGVYLITGGLGGIGLEIAQLISRKLPCTLILLSRQPASAATIERLQRIHAAGATLHVVSGDVTDIDRMRTLKEEVESRFGPINGVLHAAGSAPQSLVQRMTPSSATRVLDAKVRGTCVIHEVFSGAPCEFIVLFSSLRAMTGGVGHGDYSAANAYLDAFAEQPRAGEFTVVQSINWDGWDGIGMSQARGGAAGARVAGGFAPMSLADALKAFQWVLNENAPSRVVVSSHDLAAVRRSFERGPGGTANAAGAAMPDRPVPRRNRDGLATEYVAPRDELEATIVRIWEELLGVAPLGIEDGFLQLGGDSVTSLQVTARASAAGVHMKPFDSLTHETVGALAKALRERPAAASVAGDPAAADAEIPLTAIQQWLFDQDLRVPQHFNQAFLLRAGQRLEPHILERALQALREQHEALRTRFVEGEGAWKQFLGAADSSAVLRTERLGEIAPALRKERIESVCTNEQTTLDLVQGRLLAAVLFDCGIDEPQRLLICAHHLAVDVLSWRILLEDLAYAYQQAASGNPVRLPPRSTSFATWARRVRDYALSDAPARTLPYWEAQVGTPVAAIPSELTEAPDIVASAAAVSRTLDLGGDRVSSTAVSLATFLAALGYAISRTRDAVVGSIDLENHGREALFDDVDVSRTVGWFTTLFPFVLDVRPADPPAVTLARVNAALSALPNRGFDFGVLSCLPPRRIQRKQRGEILVLWLGRLGDDRSQDGAFSMAAESPGATQNPEDRRLHAVEIMARIVGTELQMTIGYSRNRHRRATLERFADQLLESFEALVCAAGDALPSERHSRLTA